MDLVIDIGNTNTKLAFFEKTQPGIIAADTDITTIPGEPLKDVLENIIDQKEPENCILSSVIHHQPYISKILRKKTFLIEMNPGTPLPLINRYKTPDTLGYDRIAAAVAAKTLFPGKNVLTINAGTCIIYDFINSNGEYLGGSISPGMKMRFEALHNFTGKLPLITSDETEQLTGDTTESSIRSGVVEGIIAEIKGITERYREKYPDINVILSGGDLNYLVKRLKINIFAFQNIVIHGLHQILLFNVDHTS